MLLVSLVGAFQTVMALNGRLRLRLNNLRTVPLTGRATRDAIAQRFQMYNGGRITRVGQYLGVAIR